MLFLTETGSGSPSETLTQSVQRQSHPVSQCHTLGVSDSVSLCVSPVTLSVCATQCFVKPVSQTQGLVTLFTSIVQYNRTYHNYKGDNSLRSPTRRSFQRRRFQLTNGKSCLLFVRFRRQDVVDKMYRSKSTITCTFYRRHGEAYEKHTKNRLFYSCIWVTLQD